MYSFRPHPNYGGQYFETETHAEMGAALKKYVPENTIFRCVKQAGENFYTVLHMSQYSMGPTIAGYLRRYDQV